ncbi:MAG TPA: outer membrane beta-barrel protein, partial [Flavisolibacter sp.]|nr:outer membrane beta-barrel protein [Flavisolibacter sp.]
FDVNGSYFYNHVQTQNFRKSLRQTFATDTTYINDDQASSLSYNNNQRFNLRMTYTIDSLNSIIYNPNISFQNSESNSNDTTSYFYNTKAGLQQLNESRTLNNNSGNGNNWSNDLIWRKRFRKKGRTLAVSFSNTLSNNERDSYNNINARIRPRNYYSNTQSSTNNFGTAISYTEPVGKDKVLELNYSYNNNRSESDKETYDFNNATSKFDLLNDSLTNHFQNFNESQRVGTNFRVVKTKYNYQLGIAAQDTKLESNNLSKGSLLSQNYFNFFPTAMFNYQFAKTRSLRFSYRGRTSQPSISQLQDVLNIGNYPYLSKGNPDLKQEFSNNFALNYNFFNTTNFKNIFIALNYSNTLNKIVNSVTINRDGTQLTMPVNLNGSYAVNGNINFGLPIQRMQGGNFNTTTR